MSVAHTTGPRIGSLCSGYGGLDLAVELVLGGHLAWYAETDRHATTVLAYHWPHIPNLGDIRAVDWTQAEPIDILTAGFPCQDISNAGKRAGITGEHSSLWTHVARAVRDLRSSLVFVMTADVYTSVLQDMKTTTAEATTKIIPRRNRPKAA
ncbi:C-5 cytosine-specific DNA methylase [Micromonospora pallida]|uniref:C-5 cytosine-specific DNA methylase n=1 Tax=Micromonospora pallida TaxID=145854 RepID=A0A1C6RTI3_9ACTN|nr:DNA cytosine methyltransferase [Micromonospora pallida]SCL20515.1 C-5 cytosine-specific DNA methylase [Micromonospora pallida]